MNLGNFVSGMVVGGVLVWGSQTYHVLRTDQGIQLVPKMQPSFAETYLDVRQFGISDWARHKTVAAAVVAAGKQEVFTQHASETVTQGVGDLVREWNRLLPGQQ
jgi:hypothetical protein